MEIAIRHQASGGTVKYHNLRKGLPICEDYNHIHRLIELPTIRINAAHDLIGNYDGIEHHIDSFSKAERKAAEQEARTLTHSVQTTDEFLKIGYREFHDIGWGALSSAISVRRDSTISYPHGKKLLLAYLASSIMLYQRITALIEEERPDQILLFNGRFATTRPAMRAAENCGIPWLIHERGRDKNHYWVPNYQPHNFQARQRDMISSWRPDLEELAHDFFQDRRNRIEREWHSFTKDQKVGKLPPAMKGAGEWLTFFTSSDDELVAIGNEYRNKFFPTQSDALKSVYEVTENLTNLRLCIRVHPHVAKKSRNDKSAWDKLKLPGAIVIGPTEDIDSYALIERSKIVACYGSTIGVEATYWRRPSMLLGTSFYDKLDVATLVKNEDEIHEYCQRPVVHSIAGALIYGAYFRTFGEKFKYYEAGDLHRGEILGRNLDNSPQMRLVNLLINGWRDSSN